MKSKIPLTIVLPVHNESGSIVQLLKEIVDVCSNVLHTSAEIIVVDDASDDDSVAKVEAFTSGVNSAEKVEVVGQPFIRLIRHTTRTGQSGALMDGFIAAQGEVIVSMDADGQFDPRDIPRMLLKMDVCAIVCGVRHQRRDGIIRKSCSVIANGVRNVITGDALTDAGCTFRCMRRKYVELLLPLQGRLLGCEFFFHPLMIRRAGGTVGEVPVSHRARTAGKSNYHLVRGRMGRGLKASLMVRRMLDGK